MRMLFGLLIIVVGAIFAAGWPARADSGCYPASDVEVFRRTRAHSRYWDPQWDSKAVALRLGERFAVQSSTMFEDVCWVKVSAGWIRSISVVPAAPLNSDGAPPPPETVKLQWQLPEAPVPGSARTEFGLPRIDGGDFLVTATKQALDYLDKRMPDWYVFVVTNTRSVGPSSEHDRSTADGSIKHTAIAAEHTDSIIVLASVLVHEACHMVQYDRDGATNPYDYDRRIEKERECLRIQRDMMHDYDPTHTFLNTLTRMLSRSDSDWMMYLR